MERVSEKEKDELYKEVEAELMQELHDYISSYVKSFDLEKGHIDSSRCLTNFKCFSYHMLKQYQEKLTQRRALSKCKQ